ncbi:hypothetical protein Pint_07020 [Pistacia integerrima]|uniref:Uncharacterized protein n=1 Tax=Pistacia integerrima TaxID=434235 RepID=A0ACC0XXS6_9ROSI|nr:hypothetical protein Pint_07020 [Pistacia integerrima]
MDVLFWSILILIDWWEANSCGYHGDDGLLYHGQAKGKTFGPTFTSNDTVGGGINYASQEFFFTKNGALVGTVCKEIKGPLFPTIAVHSQNEESSTVHFNADAQLIIMKILHLVAKVFHNLAMLLITLQAEYGLLDDHKNALWFMSTLGRKNLLLILRQHSPSSIPHHPCAAAPPPHSSLAPATATATAPTQNPTERKPFVSANEIASSKILNAGVSPILAGPTPPHCSKPAANTSSKPAADLCTPPHPKHHALFPHLNSPHVTYVDYGVEVGVRLGKVGEWLGKVGGRG